jgi:hypothetical protein
MTWEQVALQLHDALSSFMAYDGMGQGGAEDGNRGDWELAERAMINYSARSRCSDSTPGQDVAS